MNGIFDAKLSSKIDWSGKFVKGLNEQYQEMDRNLSQRDPPPHCKSILSCKQITLPDGWRACGTDEFGLSSVSFELTGSMIHYGLSVWSSELVS
jgi:hypothetical protein